MELSKLEQVYTKQNQVCIMMHQGKAMWIPKTYSYKLDTVRASPLDGYFSVEGKEFPGHFEVSRVKSIRVHVRGKNTLYNYFSNSSRNNLAFDFYAQPKGLSRSRLMSYHLMVKNEMIEFSANSTHVSIISKPSRYYATLQIPEGADVQALDARFAFGSSTSQGSAQNILNNLNMTMELEFYPVEVGTKPHLSI